MNKSRLFKQGCRLTASLLVLTILFSALIGCGEPIPVTTVLTTPFETDAPSHQEKPSPYPVVEDLIALRDLLYESTQGGNYAPEFVYTGDPADLTAQTIARILAAYYIQIKHSPDLEGYRQVICTPYPGDRIVNAYRNGDTSQLSEDELQALSQAVKVVEDAKLYSATPVEIELYLHDWLCNQVTYYDGDTTVESATHIVRPLTAIGALIDGQANCQGYTDAFYVLAAIAGFDVGRQSCDAPDGGHMFNTIRVNGKWYIVDVTFDDDTYLDQDRAYTDYRLFNAGIDVCGEYAWPEEYQTVPLEPKSDEVYYYYLSDVHSNVHGYKKSYDDLLSVAKGIIALRQQAHSGKSFYMMLRGGEANSNELQSALKAEGMYSRVSIWALKVGDNTFFYIDFY